jgi:hydroxyacyl-ACP dehydratase HTD2-like protein with hotdog domain
MDEMTLLSFMSLHAKPDRTSVDYDYATQALGCPGLVVPMDLIALLLIVLLGRAKPRSVINALDYHIFGQIFTGQSVRLCATALDQQSVLIWAKASGFLVYRGIVRLEQA